MVKFWGLIKGCFQKSYFKFVLIGLPMILSVPVIVSILMEWPLMNLGSQKAESWMSFWGGYLGAIIGLLAVIYTTNKQIKNSKELMLEQIRNQTDQIKVSANIHDELERKRVYINTILEKNLEIQRFIRELQRIFNNNIKKCDEIFEEVLYMNNNFIQRDALRQEFKLSSSIANQLALNEVNQKIIKEKLSYEESKKTLYILKEELQDANNRLYSYKVFVDLESNQSSNYATQITELVNNVEKILENINLIAENPIYGSPERLNIFKRKISDNEELIQGSFESLNDLSVSHINSLLNALVGR